MIDRFIGWLAFVATLVFVSPSPLHASEIVLACIDCYGSAALYPVVAQQHFGEYRIRWIHVRTEKFPTKAQLRDWEQTKHFYDHALTVDMDHPADVTRAVDFLAAAKIRRAIGGMETGAFQSDIFNSALKLPGNDPRTGELRRAKYPMAGALGDLGIPTLLSGDCDEIEAFIATLESEFVVVKPNRSSGSEGLEFVHRSNLPKLRAVLKKMFAEHDKYGHPMTSVVIQPAIVGVEYVANTFRDGKKTYLLGAWRYLKVRAPGSGKLVYFLDRPVDPDSKIGRQLEALAPSIHERLGNHIGPGHAELLLEDLTKRWYVVEQAARIAGTGVPAIEAEIWGTSHLHTNIAFSLGPEVFAKEIAKALRVRRHDAAIFNFLALAPGAISTTGVALLERQESYFPPFSIFRPEAESRFVETIDLATSPFVASFTGPNDVVLRNIDRMIAAQLQDDLFRYDERDCSELLLRQGQLEQRLLDARLTY